MTTIMTRLSSAYVRLGRGPTAPEGTGPMPALPCMEAVEGRLLMSGDAPLAFTLATDGGGDAFTPNGRQLVVAYKGGLDA